MKNLILATFAFVAIIGIGFNANAQSKENVAIKKVMNNYFDALNASDADKVIGLFTADGKIFASGAPTATGTATLKATFEYVFNNYTYSLAQTVDEIKIQGNFAFVTSTSKGSYNIKSNNKKIEDNFRELFILERIKGNWKISQYMYNSPQ